jgi:hypothetical protein
LAVALSVLPSFILLTHVIVLDDISSSNNLVAVTRSKGERGSCLAGGASAKPSISSFTDFETAFLNQFSRIVAEENHEDDTVALREFLSILV